MIESQLSWNPLPQVPAHLRTDLRLDALLWGCVMAFVLASKKDREKFAAQLRLPIWLGVAVILMLSIAFYSVLSSVFVAVLIPGLLAGTLVHPEWKITRALSWPPITWLGRISYSLYLWQQIFFPPGWENAPQWWRHWPVNLALAFAAATLSYYAIEKPLIAVGRRLAANYAKMRLDASIFKYNAAAINDSPQVIRKGTFQP
jgi:peptidoglycan/LPS O-acetylase OafA/YrhL